MTQEQQTATTLPVVVITDESVPEMKGLEESRAEKIRQTFNAMADTLQKFEDRYQQIVADSKSEITQALTKKAKRLRLDIRGVRTEAERVRKAEKAQYLQAGKAVDGIANILKAAVTDREEHLQQIEEHFERLEQKRLQDLQRERVELLAPYVDDPETRDLSSMDPEIWSAFLAKKKQEHEELQEAKRIAEQQRLQRERDEAEQRQRDLQERQRLQQEADEARRQAEAAQQRLQAEQAERQRIEQEAAQRQLQAEQEQQRLQEQLQEQEQRFSTEGECRPRDLTEAAPDSHRDLSGAAAELVVRRPALGKEQVLLALGVAMTSPLMTDELREQVEQIPYWVWEKFATQVRAI